MAPYHIEFHLTDDPLQIASTTLTPFNDTMFACNDPNYQCSCVDCLKSCGAPDPWPLKQEPCMTAGILCPSFLALVVILSSIFFLTCLAFIISRFIARIRLQRSASLLSDVPETGEDVNAILEPFIAGGQKFKSYWLNDLFHRLFYRLGKFLAHHPVKVLLFTALAVAVSAASFGWNEFQVETNPARLWVGPASKNLQQKAYFDETFGPFYRIEQLIFTNTKPNTTIIRKDTLDKIFRIEAHINGMTTLYENKTLKLTDLCYEPIPGRCMVQTITDIWKDYASFQSSSDWLYDFDRCTTTPNLCLRGDRPPLMTNVMLGGYTDTADLITSNAMITTILLNNFVDETKQHPAMAWETELIAYLTDLQHDEELASLGIQFSFSTEVTWVFMVYYRILLKSN